MAHTSHTDIQTHTNLDRFSCKLAGAPGALEGTMGSFSRAAAAWRGEGASMQSKK